MNVLFEEGSAVEQKEESLSVLRLYVCENKKPGQFQVKAHDNYS